MNDSYNTNHFSVDLRTALLSDPNDIFEIQNSEGSTVYVILPIHTYNDLWEAAAKYEDLSR